MVKISIIIPTYNEIENIERLVNEINKHVSNHEIVIVDDASTDGTAELIDKLEKVNPIHRKEKGIFSAIQEGIKNAKGEIIVIMDADFSHIPHKIPELLKYMDEYDMVSGSRFIESSGIIAPFKRKYGTILLNKVCRLILGLKPKDLTGGFHAMWKKKFDELEFRYPSLWGEFDMEWFKRASEKDFKIKEIPFVYEFRKEGESKGQNLLRYGYIYLKRALELRLCK